MAEELAPTEVTASEWGLPLNWDGHEQRQYQFFVRSIEEITKEGWAYIFKSNNTAWVISPERTQHANHDEREPFRAPWGRGNLW
jgi:hypothetical protein